MTYLFIMHPTMAQFSLALVGVRRGIAWELLEVWQGFIHVLRSQDEQIFHPLAMHSK